MGIVYDVIYKPGNKPPKLPELVYVQFEDYLGKSAIPGVDKVVPMTPTTQDWIFAKKPCSRTQFQLTNASSITIHKSQGIILLT